MAVVVFARQFHPYLICCKFTLRTDHSSLAWLRNFKQPEGQLARWLEQLQELQFDVVHRRGTAHNNADVLSRLPCRQCGRDSHDTPNTLEIATTIMQLPGCHTDDTLRQMQLSDILVGPLLQGTSSRFVTAYYADNTSPTPTHKGHCRSSSQKPSRKRC